MGLAAGCGDISRPCSTVQCQNALYLLHCTEAPRRQATIPEKSAKNGNGKGGIQKQEVQKLNYKEIEPVLRPLPLKGERWHDASSEIDDAASDMRSIQSSARSSIGMTEGAASDLRSVQSSARSSIGMTEGEVSFAADSEVDGEFADQDLADYENHWGSAPLVVIRDLLEAGHLRKGDQRALEEELGTFHEEALSAALEGAHERQTAYTGDRHPKLSQPKEMFWQKKKAPALRHGASVTNAAIVPKRILWEWRRLGFSVLVQSRVGVVLLCGATGMRSIADVGLPSEKSLLQLLCERVRRLMHLARRSYNPRGATASSASGLAGVARNKINVSIPLYVMTDTSNHFEIASHLKDHGYFGLDANDVCIFPQEMDPIFDREGHVLLESPSQVARAPGGGGAMFDTLRRRGLQEDMSKRGLSHICVMPCDNMMAHIADPLLLGYSLALNVQCSLKVVARSGTSDPLGVFCTHHEHKTSRACVVERFELHAEARLGKAKDGHLRLRVCSLAHHVFTLDLLMDNFRLPVIKPHVVPIGHIWYDPHTGKMREPEPKEHNAIRLESFVSDVFEKLERVPGLLVDRDSEFAALRLHEDDKSINPAALALSSLHQRWIIEAGGSFRKGAICEEDQQFMCEISPLVSYSGEGLEGHFFEDLTLPLHLGARGEDTEIARENIRNADLSTRDAFAISALALPDAAIAERCLEGEELPPTPPEEGTPTDAIFNSRRR